MNQENLEDKIKLDIDFVRLLKLGDKQALNQLWKSLYRDSQKISRKYNQPVDIGYDAAIRAYENLVSRGIAKFEFRSSFRSYCWTIVTRELIRLLKKEVFTETLDLEIEVHAAEPTPEKKATPDTILDRIQPCLDLLKGNRLLIFNKIDIDLKNPGEVAEELGLSRNNVNQIASRARREIRACLEGYGFKSVSDVMAT